MNINEIVIPELDKDVNVTVDEEKNIVVMLKDLINVIIAFFNNLIKFEF